MSILEEIMERKKREVLGLYSSCDIQDMRKRCDALPPCKNLVEAVRSCKKVPIIAEIKKKSPSRGAIKEDVDVKEMAKKYQESGAVAVSILTDQVSFGGNLTDLEECVPLLDIPVLRKDFILDEIQLFQSRLAGADAVLLIAAALEIEKYAGLLHTALELGMTPLTEVHNVEELKAVLPYDPPVIGINNRNLHTLKVSTGVTKQLVTMIPDGVVTISESGIKDTGDIGELTAAGADGFLIGTALMTADDPESLLKRMCG